MTALDHSAEERASHPKKCQSVDVQSCGDPLLRGVQEALTTDDAGIVDEDIDLAAAQCRACDCFTVCDINNHGGGRPARPCDLGRGCLAAFFINVPYHHVRTAFCGLVCQVPPQAAGASSDEDLSAGEVIAHDRTCYLMLLSVRTPLIIICAHRFCETPGMRATGASR